MSTTELTPEIRAKRVAIAKDVIARLDAYKLTVCQGSYIRGKMDSPFPKGADLQPHVDSVESSCRVCMLGAALLSKARLFNEVPADWLIDDEDDPTYLGAMRSAVTVSLESIFDLATLDLMESVFEEGECGSTACRSDRVKAARFGETFDGDADAAARAVCNILIANDGEFVLPAKEAHP